MNGGYVLDMASEEGYYFDRGLFLPEGYKVNRRPIGIDLFSGAGGFSLGFISAGWDVIAAIEWDVAAIHTYLWNLGAYPVQMIFIDDIDRERMEKYLSKCFNASLKRKERSPVMMEKFGEIIHPLETDGLVSGGNRSNVVPDFDGVKYMFVGDVRKIRGERMLEIIGLQKGDVDCIFGGPPCQGYSRGNNKRNVMDPRNSLVFDFMRLVTEIKPKTFVMENVPGMVDMLTPEGIPVVDAISKIAEDGGFGDYERIKKALVSTAGCGAVFRGKNMQGKEKKKNRNKMMLSVENQTPLFGEEVKP